MLSSVLPRSFYLRDPVSVAQDLLGQVLVHRVQRARITEVEAYPHGDPAAHSSRGRTRRTEVLFGPAGFAYVYLIYGIYDCLNVSCEPEGSAGCVLLRGVEGVRGPGRLTRAFGVTRQHNGVDLTQGPLRIERGRTPSGILVTPRIGISRAKEALLRFVAV
jgi:DNA-3-methyladenine glycosylase